MGSLRDLYERLAEIKENIRQLEECEKPFLKETPIRRADELLLHGTKTGKLDILKFMVEEEGISVNDKRYGTYFTLLYIAALNGNTEVVKYLVSKGADKDYVGVRFQHTALAVAVRRGHIDTAKALIELGAKRDYQDLFNQTQNPNMIRLILDVPLVL